jgi:hypothetical protein
MSRAPDDGGFLSRWSRRKTAAPDASRPAEHPAPKADGSVADPPPADNPPLPPEMTAEELAALPPIDTATVADDLMGYLRRGAPAAQRLAAMRRMWTLNPVIRGHVDPALDYAFDFNTPGAAPWAPLGEGFDVRGAAERVLGPSQSGADRGDDAEETTPPVEDRPAVATAEPTPEDDVGARLLRQDAAVPAVHDPAQSPTDHADAASPGSKRGSRRRHGGAVPI